MYGNDFYNILTNDEPQPPMTLAELRERLKHIAVCCSGLSIDLANEITLREQLTAENEQLRQELAKEKAIPKRRRTMTDAQCEKHRQAMREYWQRKKAERAEQTERDGTRSTAARATARVPRRNTETRTAHDTTSATPSNNHENTTPLSTRSPTATDTVTYGNERQSTTNNKE